MKTGILLWLIFNVFESVKTDFRHQQQQREEEDRLSKPINDTYPRPLKFNDEKKAESESRSRWMGELNDVEEDEAMEKWSRKAGGPRNPAEFEREGAAYGANSTEDNAHPLKLFFPSHPLYSSRRSTTPLFVGISTGDFFNVSKTEDDFAGNLFTKDTRNETLPDVVANGNAVEGAIIPRADKLLAVREIGENEECIERILDDFLMTDDLVSGEILAEKNEAKKLANLLVEMSGGIAQMKNLIEGTMEKHPRIVSISTSVTKGPEKTKMSQTIYRKGGTIFINEDRRGYPQFATSDRSYWTPVFQDCITGNWIFGFSFTITNPNQRSDATVYFGAESITGSVDQCRPKFRYVLNGGPKCEAATTQCVPVPHSGFHLGGYKCVCRPGFYFPENSTSSQKYFSGSEMETGAINGNLTKFRCLPCPDSCSDSCSISGACIVGQNDLLRYIILSIQISCIFFTLILTVLVFKHRKCKTIATGMWTILEMILLGSIILYGSVLVRSFHPSTELCLLEPWCREIGFVICYGAIILKLYRILIEFRTRKAHRAVVRDKDLLKYLLGMVIVVVGYMAAWTAINLNLVMKENYSVVVVGLADEGRIEFKACKAVWWDYVTETGEILFLIFGVHLSYASRNSTTQFQERCFLSVAISLEAVISTILYVLRFFYWDVIDPDVSFFAYFARSQLTTTVILLLVFVPKWWYQQFQINRSRVSRNYLMQESGRSPFEAFKPQDGVMTTNSDVEGEISLADMNPEDIRAELKRLYTQLEVLKNKTIRIDNPHISKRRGGRKIAHRRFSLQKKGSREKTLRQQTQRLSAKHADAEVLEAEPSRTPEDSVCSNEGPSIIINDGPSDVVNMTPKKGQK